MSSLPLLDRPVSSETVSLTCTPAIAVLLIGVVVVMFDIVNKSPQNAGLHLMITILVALGVLVLCFMGLTEVGSLIVLLPIIIFAGIVIIIVLALMIGEQSPPDEKHRKTAVIHKHKEYPLRSSYKYVMTGKGFARY